MDLIRNIDKTRAKLADVYVGDTQRIEQLRLILSEQFDREFTYEEAREIATDLLSLYRTLAQGKKIVLGGLKNKRRLKEG